MTNSQILWKKFIEGDQQALTSIYFDHADALIQYGRKYTLNHEIIEDSVQEVFASLIRNRKNLCSPNNIRFYLLSAFRHCLIREINRSRKKLQISPSVDENEFSISFNIETELSKEHISKKQNQLINNLMESLSPRQKEAIYLRYTNELSHGEIATLMNISEQVSRNLVSQAIKRMKEQLDLLHIDIECFVLFLHFMPVFSSKN